MKLPNKFPATGKLFRSTENISLLEKISFLLRGKFSEVNSGLKRCYLLVIRLSVAQWISTIEYCINKIIIITVKSSLSKINFSSFSLVASTKLPRAPLDSYSMPMTINVMVLYLISISVNIC